MNLLLYFSKIAIPKVQSQMLTLAIPATLAGSCFLYARATIARSGSSRIHHRV